MEPEDVHVHGVEITKPIVLTEEITVINMQYNRIKTIKSEDFGELGELVLLRLDQNQINDIRPGAFSKMPKLDELVLSKNNIASIPDDLFHPDAPLLKGVKLMHNGLTSFPLLLLKKIRKVINVSNNPINCNCMSYIPKDLKSKVLGYCASPPHLKGRKINEITYKDVNCDVCEGVECNHGSCYSYDGEQHQCICDLGYKGKDCSEKYDYLKTIPTPTSTTTATLTTTMTATTAKPTTLTTPSTTAKTPTTPLATTDTTKEITKVITNMTVCISAKY